MPSSIELTSCDEDILDAYDGIILICFIVLLYLLS